MSAERWSDLLGPLPVEMVYGLRVAVPPRPVPVDAGEIERAVRLAMRAWVWREQMRARRRP